MSALRQVLALLLLILAITAMATVGFMALLNLEYETAVAMGWMEP